jgi:Xaa-Pro aminopeptidase
LEAQKGLPELIEVKQYTKSFYETLIELTNQYKIKRLGFDSRHVTLAQFNLLKKSLTTTVDLVEANNLIENFREVKDESEIRLIRQALAIHKEALKLMKKTIKPGLTERDVFLKLDQFVKSKGVDYSFSPIIASGPNSCFPHARVTDRKIKNNEPVLLDMGIDVKGYKSDLTRMFFLGRIAELVSRVNENVYQAQQNAIKLIKPGVCIADVDRAARGFLEEKGFGKYFGHSLGHGVGLEIHESPRISQTNKAVLKEGMVITVEPAVYLPNKFGIRLEEMVLVTSKGCEVLSGNID